MSRNLFRSIGAFLLIIAELLSVKNFNILMMSRHEAKTFGSFTNTQPYPYWNLFIMILLMVGLLFVLRPKQTER